MKNIIQKAIEGGWKVPFNHYDFAEHMIYEPVFEGNDISYREISTDPLFWQALGKACGWKYVEGEALTKRDDNEGMHYLQEWMYTAMTFHEVNLTEGWDKAVEWLEKLIKE